MDLFSGQQLLNSQKGILTVYASWQEETTAKQEVKPKLDQTSRFNNQSTGKTRERSM